MDNSQLLSAPITAQFGQDTSSATAAAPKTHSASGFEGWLERNAQTIGSIALPVAADVATLGAATPWDPLLAAAGGGVGQEVKNKTTGTTTNPLEEAGISGALTLGGQVVGKAAAPLFDKLGNVADKFGYNLLSKVGGTVDKNTARALNPQTIVKMMAQLGIKPEDFDGTAQSFMNIIQPLVDKGIGNADKVDTNGLSEMVDSLVNNETSVSGMADEKGTAAFKLSNTLKSTLNKLSGVTSNEGAPIMSNTAASDILAPNADPSEVNTLLGSLKEQVSKLIGNGRNPMSISDAAKGEANVKKLLIDELEDRLYGGDKTLTDGTIIKGANADSKVIGGLNQKAVTAVRAAGNQIADHGDTVDIVSKDGSRTSLDRASFNKLGGGNGQDTKLVDDKTVQALKDTLPDTPLSQRYIKAIANAKTIGELKSSMSPFVRASQLAAAKAAAEGGGMSLKSVAKATPAVLSPLTGFLAGGPVGAGVGGALDVALGTDTGQQMIGDTLTGNNWLGRLLRGAPDMSQDLKVGANLTVPAAEQAPKTLTDVVKSVVGNTFTKTLTQTLPRTAAAIESFKGSTAQSATQVTNTVDTAINEALSSMPSSSTIETSNNGVLSASTFQQLINQYGNNGLNTYLSYLKTTQPQLTQEQQTNWMQGQTLLSTIKNAADLYSQSNAGPIKGRLTEMTGVLGTKSGAAAQAYDSQVGSIIANVVDFASAGGGAAGRAQLTKEFEQLLPKLGDSAQTAATKFSALVQQITIQMQNNLAAPATNVPGQLTSFAGATPTGGTGGSAANNTSNILNYLPPSMVQGF